MSHALALAPDLALIVPPLRGDSAFSMGNLGRLSFAPAVLCELARHVARAPGSVDTHSGLGDGLRAVLVAFARTDLPPPVVEQEA